MLHNFSWVIPNKLAGSNLPGNSFNNTFGLIQDLLKLKQLGVTTIVSVIEELPKGFKEQCNSIGLESLWFPIQDYDIPTDINKYREFIENIITKMKSGNVVVTVHCKMGIGRTGTTLACIIGLLNNLTSNNAIKFVRYFRSNSIENQKQIKFIQLFLDKEISESNIKGVLENDQLRNR